jgi:hypothetical protein
LWLGVVAWKSTQRVGRQQEAALVQQYRWAAVTLTQAGGELQWRLGTRFWRRAWVVDEDEA